MNLIEGLKELGGFFRSSPDGQDPAGLEDPKNLKRLGRIIAVDLFIGNEDRFEFAQLKSAQDMTSVPKDVQKTDTFGKSYTQTVLLNGPNDVICNVGNIVFKPKTGDPGSLSGSILTI